MAILDLLETYLRYEPERVSQVRIERVRGNQNATYRLRVGDYRMFYDVREGQVIVTTVLHKRETFTFYREEQMMKTSDGLRGPKSLSPGHSRPRRADIVIVTRNGKPVAAIQAIDDDDIEDLLLERSPRFWDMINRARRGKPIAIDVLRKQIGQKGPRGKPRGARGRAGRPAEKVGGQHRVTWAETANQRPWRRAQTSVYRPEPGRPSGPV